MATYTLGRIGLRICGEYSATTSYEKLDSVTYNGSSYVAKQDVEAGIAPTNTTYWTLMAQGEKQLAQGQALILGNGTSICGGVVCVVPTVNTPTGNAFRYPHKFKYRPVVVANAEAPSIGTSVRGATPSGVETDHAIMNVYRTTSTIMPVHYLAFGEAEEDAYSWDYQTPYEPTEELLNAKGIYITPSSEVSPYVAWHIMDGNLNYTHAFAPGDSDANPYVDIQMPHKLKNMVVLLGNGEAAGNSTYPYVHAGSFEGSNNGTEWTPLGTFSGHDTTAAYLVTEFPLNNAAGYNRLRIKMTKPSTATRLNFTDVRIRGTIVE